LNNVYRDFNNDKDKKVSSKDKHEKSNHENKSRVDLSNKIKDNNNAYDSKQNSKYTHKNKDNHQQKLNKKENHD